ncbi:Uncharacterised protein [Vibrio cholerae]|nr:Uncharacterised protein [Vibrio cholerae]
MFSSSSNATESCLILERIKPERNGVNQYWALRSPVKLRTLCKSTISVSSFCVRLM